MRRIKEVLRLHFELGRGQREIARCLDIAQSTVNGYLSRAQAAGLSWPLPEGLEDDRKLETALFRQAEPALPPRQSLPDFVQVEHELRSHRNLTLLLLWQEYHEAHPEGYSYSRFCVLYRRWKRKQDVVLRQDHKAGEKLFVDWAGDKLPIYDRHSGSASDATIFVASLGASSYTYAEATVDQQLASWIGAHVRTFAYLGGCPRFVVPDNTKTAVSRACRYDPDLNPTYQAFAIHYGVGILPARPYKARDKAIVEVNVQVVQRWILAALRHRKFFSLAEANQAIRELLLRLNHRPFRKRTGTRASLFEQLDKPALQPLPATPYDLSEWSKARINIDYHCVFDENFYSVPYTLVHELVEIRSTPTTVEIFHHGQRVASHPRSQGKRKAITNPQHRPKSHQAHLEWTPSRMVNWAASIGPQTAQLFDRILKDKPHPEMGYRSCLGIIRLASKYSPARMEAAADLALQSGACRYKSIDSILRKGLDQQPRMLPSSTAAPLTEHENLRGPQYFSAQEATTCSNNQ
jgi:transposase